jgi:hypothetical protein
MIKHRDFTLLLLLSFHLILGLESDFSLFQLKYCSLVSSSNVLKYFILLRVTTQWYKLNVQIIKRIWGSSFFSVFSIIFYSFSSFPSSFNPSSLHSHLSLQCTEQSWQSCVRGLKRLRNFRHSTDTCSLLNSYEYILPSILFSYITTVRSSLGTRDQILYPYRTINLIFWL